MKRKSTYYAEKTLWIESQQCTTVNETIDRNTEGVLYKCIEKGGKFLKYFVDAAVWAIGFLKRWG